MAHARSPALPDRRGAGPACLYGRLLRREGLRRTGLHASLCRPYAWPDATVVQHGALRQSREAGCSPTPVEGAALSCASTAPGTPRNTFALTPAALPPAPAPQPVPPASA